MNPDLKSTWWEDECGFKMVAMGDIPSWVTYTHLVHNWAHMVQSSE